MVVGNFLIENRIKIFSKHIKLNKFLNNVCSILAKLLINTIKDSFDLIQFRAFSGLWYNSLCISIVHNIYP